MNHDHVENEHPEPERRAEVEAPAAPGLVVCSTVVDELLEGQLSALSEASAETPRAS